MKTNRNEKNSGGKILTLLFKLASSDIIGCNNSASNPPISEPTIAIISAIQKLPKNLILNR